MMYGSGTTGGIAEDDAAGAVTVGSSLAYAALE